MSSGAINFILTKIQSPLLWGGGGIQEVPKIEQLQKGNVILVWGSELFRSSAFLHTLKVVKMGTQAEQVKIAAPSVIIQ